MKIVKLHAERLVIDYFEQLAQQVPLGIFVFVGTFLEEVLSPIPSFLVLIPAGASAKIQQLPFLHIAFLTVLCGIARVLGGSILYWLATKLEGALLGNRRLLGLTHQDIVSLSQRLRSGQQAWRAWIVLFILHALPVFPGTLLSAGSGFIKIPYSTFATATFFGSIVNASVYLWLGYIGMQTAEYISHLGWLADILTVVILLALLVWLANRWRRRSVVKRSKSL